MLRSLMDITGYALNAKDGEIGLCEDFLIEDKPWIVRYLVAKTGTWLFGRRVLIPLADLECPDDTHRFVHISLSRAEVESSEPITADPPVSHELGTESYLYYGWPSTISNVSLDPLVKPTSLPPGKTRADAFDSSESALRSANEMAGYVVHAGDLAIGVVSDFIIDPSVWAIRYLVAKVEYDEKKKHILIPADAIIGVSWPHRRMDVAIDVQRFAEYPACRMVPRLLDPKSEQELRDFMQAASDKSLVE